MTEEFESIVPSHDPFEGCTESREAVCAESPLAAAKFKAGSDGFLKTPPREVRLFEGLLATVFDPDLGIPPYDFLMGLGLLLSAGVAIGVAGSFDTELSEGLDAVFRITGVFAGCISDALDRGVPWIVESGALKVFVEARKLCSSVLPLELGRLPAREDALPEPSEL